MSVSVAVLLPGFVSVTPSGAATEAELTTEPVAPAAIETVRVRDRGADGQVDAGMIAPVPAAGHTPPPAPTHVQVIEVTPAGSASVTVAP